MAHEVRFARDVAVVDALFRTQLREGLPIFFKRPRAGGADLRLFYDISQLRFLLFVVADEIRNFNAWGGFYFFKHLLRLGLVARARGPPQVRFGL